ncbi:hybrid sensor histidine kinase/response regulator [bacterium]|nr:hybrid sensor histidine kinase/response regulator [bacterium]
MVSNEEAFFKELLSMFKIEAEEHVKMMSSGLLELEKERSPDKRRGIIETVYREAHSLKGAARAVNLVKIETVCQSLESVFAAIKREQITLRPDLFDVLHLSVDTVSRLLDAPDATDIAGIMQKLLTIEEKEIKRGTAVKAEPAAPAKPPAAVQAGEPAPATSKPAPAPQPDQAEPPPKKQERTPVNGPEETRTAAVNQESDKAMVTETIRISTSKLDSLLLQAEELLSAKLTSQQNSEDIKGLISEFELWKKNLEKQEIEIRTTLHEMKKQKETDQAAFSRWTAETVLNFLGQTQNTLKSHHDRIQQLQGSSRENARILGGMVDNLLTDMKQILMLPFSTLLRMMPKVVRDLSRDQGKDVELLVRGSTIEIDRRILEELKDPFIHLLRNCVDHGIEKPEERVQKGKGRGGAISISVSQVSGNKVEILVDDDGRGIDPGKVAQSALKKGIISEAEIQSMSNRDKMMLIFQSEVSTSPIITDISGRGLGLSIVREKVEKLGGTLTLDTEVDRGTVFRILLPVTLATFRGILIEVSDFQFLVPTASVERAVRFKEDLIQTVENRETVALDGQVVSFARLADIMGIATKKSSREDEYKNGLILSAEDKRVVFEVDTVQNEQEVLVKSFGKQLARVRNISGATILGNGKVVCILNVSDLIKSAAVAQTLPSKLLTTEEGKVGKKHILVAEDSITSRTLLKNILESAGYRVKTTVDGMDALTALKSDTFDLVVSDIEMPRMNGFDLVAKIRGDKNTADLPVVLVTALESREDRERGIDVGANAYIVKRSFDQSNLLEVIRKLI